MTVPMASGPSFLVCITDAIVAEDVSGILAESRPLARIAMVPTQSDAIRALGELPGPLVAFVSMSPEFVATSPLGQALTQAGATLVLLGNEAEERGERAGFLVLQRPFRSRDLLALIEA